jgi:trigger factor
MEDMKPYFDATMEMYREQASVEGFRKGKAPRQLIKTRFEADIEADSIPLIVEDHMKTAIESTNTEAIEIGEIQNMNYKRHEPMSFDFTVEIMPAFTIGNYKGLMVNKDVHQVVEEEITSTIDHLRKEHATVKEVETAEPGFVVYADVQALDDSFLPVIGKRYPDRRIQLSTDSVNQDLIDGLNGVRKGEERKVTVTVPAQGDQPEKQERYSFHVSKIEEIIVPPLDDEFAKDIGFDTVDKLREDVDKKLNAHWEAQSARLLKDRLIDAIIQNNEIPAPEAYIKNGLKQIKENFKQRYKTKTVDEEFINERYRASTIREVKWSLAFKKLIEMEQIKLTDEDVENYKNELAKSRQVPVDQIKLDFKNENEKKNFDDFLIEEKVLNLLKTNAVITEMHETQDLSRQRAQESSLIV